MRLRGIFPKVCFIASGVVGSFCSKRTWPASSITQKNDQRSPRSKPIVSFCSLKISLLNACTVLVFFIAGLLSVALRARRPLGAYRIPPETGLLIPSDKRAYRQLGTRQIPHDGKQKSVHGNERLCYKAVESSTLGGPNRCAHSALPSSRSHVSYSRARAARTRRLPQTPVRRWHRRR